MWLRRRASSKGGICCAEACFAGLGLRVWAWLSAAMSAAAQIKALAHTAKMILFIPVYTSNSRRAAINHHRLSSRKGTRFGREEYSHAGNLVRLADPFDTLARGLSFEDRRIFP